MEVQNMLATAEFDESRQKQPIAALSGGFKMRLALVTAMCLHPDMLLMDEPTNHLDVNAVAWLIQFIKSLQNVVVVVVRIRGPPPKQLNELLLPPFHSRSLFLFAFLLPLCFLIKFFCCCCYILFIYIYF
jgi:hypothetical protein